jgi:hypothetical protein
MIEINADKIEKLEYHDFQDTAWAPGVNPGEWTDGETIITEDDFDDLGLMLEPEKEDRLLQKPTFTISVGDTDQTYYFSSFQNLMNYKSRVFGNQRNFIKVPIEVPPVEEEPTPPE